MKIEVEVGPDQALITILVAKQFINKTDEKGVAPLIGKQAEDQYRELVRKHGG